MHQRMLGKTGFSVSSLTLGGGGIGMVWGATIEEEGIGGGRRPACLNADGTHCDAAAHHTRTRLTPNT